MKLLGTFLALCFCAALTAGQQGLAGRQDRTKPTRPCMFQRGQWSECTPDTLYRTRTDKHRGPPDSEHRCASFREIRALCDHVFRGCEAKPRREFGECDAATRTAQVLRPAGDGCLDKKMTEVLDCSLKHLARRRKMAARRNGKVAGGAPKERKRPENGPQAQMRRKPQKPSGRRPSRQDRLRKKQKLAKERKLKELKQEKKKLDEELKVKGEQLRKNLTHQKQDARKHRPTPRPKNTGLKMNHRTSKPSQRLNQRSQEMRGKTLGDKKPATSEQRQTPRTKSHQADMSQRTHKPRVSNQQPERKTPGTQDDRKQFTTRPGQTHGTKTHGHDKTQRNQKPTDLKRTSEARSHGQRDQDPNLPQKEIPQKPTLTQLQPKPDLKAGTEQKPMKVYPHTTPRPLKGAEAFSQVKKRT